MPEGELVTVPVHEPVFTTLSWNWEVRSKRALASLAALIVTSLWLEPLTVPGHDSQTTALEPSAGEPVSFTSVPSGKLASQLAPQEIPAGELVTVPTPAPPLATF